MSVPFGYTGNLKALRGAAQSVGSQVAQSRLGRIGMALSTAINTGAGGQSLQAGLYGNGAFDFGFSDPTGGTRRQGSRVSQYSLGWMCYSNEMFEQISYSVPTGGLPGLALWGGYNKLFMQRYNEQRGLYNKTMPLYNPTRRLVDFYASHVFPGVLSEDGATLPDGMALAIPLSKDTDPRLKAAIAQGWFWGNWQRQKSVWIRFCAACGDGPVEIIDDVESGTVYKQPVWPGEITHVEFSGRGNVTSYTRRHRVVDEDGMAYELVRQVTPDTMATFRDGDPFEVDGLPAEYENPYGFAPLVWNCHTDLGTLPGGTAIRNWNKVEKLNSFASRLHRYLERQSKSPMLLPQSQEVSRVSIDASLEEEIQILTTDGGGGIEKLDGNLELGAMEERIASLLAEIEHDHPEVVMYQALRGMSQVTGPAAEQLMGDVAGYLNDARSGYDMAEIRLNGMLVAIGGMRYREGKGGWSARNSQQEKFAPFGIDSYVRGDLDHSIDPRPLMQPSLAQQAETKMSIAAAFSAMEGAGMPLDYQIGEYGENWDKRQINALHEAQQDSHEDAMSKQADAVKATQLPSENQDAQISAAGGV